MFAFAKKMEWNGSKVRKRGGKEPIGRKQLSPYIDLRS